MKGWEKWLLSALFVTLVIVPTASLVPAVKAEVYTDNNDGGEWETIYQADEGQANADDSQYPDLTVWSISRGWFPFLGWRIKYQLYNTQPFVVPHFYDEVYLSDDSSNLYKYMIHRHHHWAEYMWAGINGPYKTQYFNIPHHGWWWVTVWADKGDDVEEGSYENNNQATVCKFF